MLLLNLSAVGNLRRDLNYRTLLSTDERWEAKGDMPIRVSCGKYRLFYEAGSEWSVIRRRGKEEMLGLQEKALTKREERKRSRWISG